MPFECITSCQPEKSGIQMECLKESMLNIVKMCSYQPVPDTCRPPQSLFWQLPNMPEGVLLQVRPEDCPRPSPQLTRETQAEKEDFIEARFRNARLEACNQQIMQSKTGRWKTQWLFYALQVQYQN